MESVGNPDVERLSGGANNKQNKNANKIYVHSHYAPKLESCVLMILSSEQEMAIRQMFLDHQWECYMQVLTEEDRILFSQRSPDIVSETFYSSVIKTEVPDCQKSENKGSETFVSINNKVKLDCSDQDMCTSSSVLATPVQVTPLILHCEQENTEQNDTPTTPEVQENENSFPFMSVNEHVSRTIVINEILPVYQIRDAPVDKSTENYLFEHNKEIPESDKSDNSQNQTFNAGTLESLHLTTGQSDARKRKREIKSKTKQPYKRLKGQTSALNLKSADSADNLCVDQTEETITTLSNEMNGETPSATDIVTQIKEACGKTEGSDSRGKGARTVIPRSKCEDCNEEFSNKKQLREHSYVTGHKILVKKRVEPNYQCEHCGQILNSITRYNEHIKLRHTGVRDLRCPICKADFSSGGSLNSHMKLAHVYEPKVCHTCGITLKNDFKLKKHMSRAHATTKYKCNVCNIAFNRQDNLMNHLKTKTHAKKLALQPDISIEYETIRLDNSARKGNKILFGNINEPDMTVNSLGINSSSENNDINSTSNMVGKTIPDTMNQLLKSPQKTTSGVLSESEDRSHRISQDGAFTPGSTPTPEQEDKILIVSKKREKHVCSVCGTTFIQLADLTTHLYSEHSEEVKKFDTLFCKVCGIKFTSASELNSHRVAKGHRFIPEKKVKEPELSFCNKCGQIVKSLWNHQYTTCPMMMENVECDICGKQFDHQYKLKSHLKLMHVHEQKTCQICKQVCRNNQAYRRHVRNHGKGVWCETCNKPFRDNHKLKEHCATQGHQQMLRQASQGNKDKPAFSACTMCDLKFALKSGLTFHMNRVHKQGN